MDINGFAVIWFFHSYMLRNCLVFFPKEGCMSIAKEIFGIYRKNENSPYFDKDDIGFNACIDLIDQHKLSEEAIIAEMLFKVDNPEKDFNATWIGITVQMKYFNYAKALKSNQSKLFVRKTK